MQILSKGLDIRKLRHTLILRLGSCCERKRDPQSFLVTFFRGHANCTSDPAGTIDSNPKPVNGLGFIAAGD
jgi:hypothetical protein